MRHIFTAPIFLRLGARMRGPQNTPVGKLHRIMISNVVAEGVSSDQGILIAGISGHPIEDVTLNNIRIDFLGGGSAAQADRQVPELEAGYPEPGSFGITPSWGLYVRHAKSLVVHHVILQTKDVDMRNSVYLEDVDGAEFEHDQFIPSAGAKAIALKGVGLVSFQACAGIPDSAAKP
jgi:hypothetical protein